MRRWLPVCVLLLLAANPAYAYIDPGAGSMLLQIILGGVAGLLVAARLLKNRLAGLFRRKPKALLSLPERDV